MRVGERMLQCSNKQCQSIFRPGHKSALVNRAEGSVCGVPLSIPIEGREGRYKTIQCAGKLKLVELQWVPVKK